MPVERDVYSALTAAIVDVLGSEGESPVDAGLLIAAADSPPA